MAFLKTKALFLNSIIKNTLMALNFRNSLFANETLNLANYRGWPQITRIIK